MAYSAEKLRDAMKKLHLASGGKEPPGNLINQVEELQPGPAVRELYSEADEARMDIVGQNGNTAEHYEQIPEARTVADMIERYEELVRENKQLKAQLETYRLGHYQAQAALARSAIAGEIQHGPGGVRVALTSEGLSLPAGTLLVAVDGGVGP